MTSYLTMCESRVPLMGERSGKLAVIAYIRLFGARVVKRQKASEMKTKEVIIV